MTDLLTSLTDGFGPTVLVAALVLAFAESACGVGTVVPGEAAILALSSAAIGVGETVLLLLAVAAGATAGDHVGYALGRRNAEHVRESRLVARMGVGHWDRTADLVRRHGPVALVVSRLVPVVRTLTPAVAGASGLSYRSFVGASAAGSLLWAAVWVGAGTAAGPLLGRLAQDPVSALPWVAAAAVFALVGRRRGPHPPVGRRAGGTQDGVNDVSGAPSSMHRWPDRSCATIGIDDPSASHGPRPRWASAGYPPLDQCRWCGAEGR